MSYTRYLAAYLPSDDTEPPDVAGTLPVLVVPHAVGVKTAVAGVRLPVLVVCTVTAAKSVTAASALPIGSMETAATAKTGPGSGVVPVAVVSTAETGRTTPVTAVLPVLVAGTVEVTHTVGSGPPARGRPQLRSYTRRVTRRSYSGRVTVH
jgi:hypothetical protein